MNLLEMLGTAQENLVYLGSSSLLLRRLKRLSSLLVAEQRHSATVH